VHFPSIFLSVDFKGLKVELAGCTILPRQVPTAGRMLRTFTWKLVYQNTKESQGKIGVRASSKCSASGMRESSGDAVIERATACQRRRMRSKSTETGSPSGGITCTVTKSEVKATAGNSKSTAAPWDGQGPIATAAIERAAARIGGGKNLATVIDLDTKSLSRNHWGAE